jgi:YggT family protein
MAEQFARRRRDLPAPPARRCGDSARLADPRRPGYACRRILSLRRAPVISSLAYVISLLLEFFVWLLIAQAIMSWLLAFNVVNYRNQAVRMIWEFLSRITEPLLRPIRRILPSFGGIDLSPLVLILVIIFLQRAILYPLIAGQPISL